VWVSLKVTTVYAVFSVPLSIVLGVAAALLLLFGIAMAISFGIKSPLDYSVFTAAAAALMVAAYENCRKMLAKS